MLYRITLLEHVYDTDLKVCRSAMEHPYLTSCQRCGTRRYGASTLLPQLMWGMGLVLPANWAEITSIFLPAGQPKEVWSLEAIMPVASKLVSAWVQRCQLKAQSPFMPQLA